MALGEMKKKETVYYSESEYNIPEKHDEFIKWWQDKISLIPAEFMDEGRVVIDAEDDGYGSTSLEVQVYYLRPETESECSDRAARETVSAENNRKKDLAQYEKLKARLGL